MQLLLRNAQSGSFSLKEGTASLGLCGRVNGIFSSKIKYVGVSNENYISHGLILIIVQEVKSNKGCDCVQNNVSLCARFINLEHGTEKVTNLFITVPVITLSNQNFACPRFNTNILSYSGTTKIENLGTNTGENVH